MFTISIYNVDEDCFLKKGQQYQVW